MGCEYFDCQFVAIGVVQGAPCGRIWREPAHQVVYLLGRARPVDAAVGLEDFGSRAQPSVVGHVLTHRFDFAGLNPPDGLGNHFAANRHQLVVDGSGVVVRQDVDAALHHDVARVYLVLEPEGGDARMRLAVDDGPVDGRGSAILR